MAATLTGRMYTSTDGITWVERSVPVTIGYRSAAYGNGMFMAVGGNGTSAVRSYDGVTWAEFALPASALWQVVAFGAGKFTVAANNSAIAATFSITYDGATLFPLPDAQLSPVIPAYIKALEAA